MAAVNDEGKEGLFSGTVSHPKNIVTLVMPITAMFVLYEVVPFPQPKAAARRHPIPSIPIPRLMAYFGGGGAPASLAQA